jgi:spore germination protein PE
MARLSIVGYVYVIEIGASSVLQVGDNVTTALDTNVFAVQREVPIFHGNEGSFKAYPFYQRPIPTPQPPEPFTMCVDNLGSYIRVRGIKVLGVSSTSMLQIGSNRVIGSESRIKNIRQFVTDKPGPHGQQTFIKLGSEDVVGEVLPAIKPPPGL